MTTEDTDKICNLCGLSCGVGTPGHLDREMGGLIDKRVSGGYESTPGNGDGALDDCTSYQFSLCEFCLDWLFERFVIPVKSWSFDSEEVWKPAAQRVDEDEWRQMKDRFHQEAARRSAARKK